jgi:hypothetical protein
MSASPRCAYWASNSTNPVVHTPYGSLPLRFDYPRSISWLADHGRPGARITDRPLLCIVGHLHNAQGVTAGDVIAAARLCVRDPECPDATWCRALHRLSDDGFGALAADLAVVLKVAFPAVLRIPPKSIEHGDRRRARARRNPFC